MQIPMYQVDAFTNHLFGGNPAAVCLLDQWLDDEILQHLAAENNLSETAFVVQSSGTFQLRWFTPTTEIDLCGHATLATSFVVLVLLEPARSCVEYDTKSGKIKTTKIQDLLALDFPSRIPEATVMDLDLVEALGDAPVRLLQAHDYLAVFETEAQIRNLNPDFEKLRQLKCERNVIVTAPGASVDFVSRFFAPKIGIPEDPVTGAAHTTLTPFWAAELGKQNLHAYQVSPRGGELWCEDRGDRVLLKGQAVLYSKGTVYLNI